MVTWSARLALAGGVAATIFASSSAFSLPAIPVKVEVGLDNGTKTLLQTLPANVREQFVIAVNEALERIDFSVGNYVKEIQLAASQTTQEITCVVGGALANSGSDIAKGLTTLLIGDSSRLAGSGEFATPPGVDASAQTLLQTIVKTRQQLRGDSPTDKVYATYSDLAFESAKLVCRLRARNAPTDFADDQVALMRRALGEWRILSRDAYCLSPDACIQKRRYDIEEIIKKEDPNLIDAASVRAEFEQLGPNPIPAPASGWQQMAARARQIAGMGGTPDYDISRTESLLYGLRDIELKIAATKSNWQWQARVEWEAAKKLMDPLPNFLKGIAGEMNPGAKGYNLTIDSEHAFQNLGRVKRSLLKARESIERAKALDARLIKTADAGLSEIQTIEQDARQKVEQVCGIYLSPHGYFRFDDRYGAYRWCNSNKSNRWALFPTVN